MSACADAGHPVPQVGNLPARPPVGWCLLEQKHHEKESLLAEGGLQPCSAWTLCYCAVMTYRVLAIQICTNVLDACNVNFIT